MILAIAYLAQLITLKYDCVATCNQLGNALQTLGQSEEAIAAYQRAIQLKPDFALAHSNLQGLLASQRPLTLPTSATET